MLFSFFESVSDEEKKFNRTGAWASIHKTTYNHHLGKGALSQEGSSLF